MFRMPRKLEEPGPYRRRNDAHLKGFLAEQVGVQEEPPRPIVSIDYYSCHMRVSPAMYRAMCIEGHYTGHTDTRITQTRTSQAIPHNHPTHKRTHAQMPVNLLVGIRIPFSEFMRMNS